MRAVSAAQQKVLQLPNRSEHLRVYVADADGKLRALHSLAGYDWVDSATLSEDVDSPVAQATVRLFRDVYSMSLAPLKEDSKLNLRGDQTYGPLLDMGRLLLIRAAVEPQDSDAPGSIWADYQDLTWNDLSGKTWAELDDGSQELFRGRIDDIDWAGERVEITARDLGGDLLDRFIETERVYGTDTGTAVEGEMQKILNDNNTGVTLYTPVSPGWYVKKWQQQKEPVLEALRKLAMQIGWDVRYKWRSDLQRFDLTFYQPDRAKTTPDWTFGPDDYYNVERLRMSRAGVRNVVRVVYTDSADGQRRTVERSDTNSINRYGRRFMEIAEASSSQIDTSTEATKMADGALADLKDPKAEMEIELPLFWPAELGDLYRFTANGVHFSTDQDLAVVAIRHELTRERCRTYLTVRGKPAGAYTQWLYRETRPGIAPPPRLVSLAAPTGVTAASIIRGISVTVPEPPFERSLWKQTIVRVKSAPGGAAIKTVKGRQTLFEITEGLTAGTTYYADAQYEDTSGNVSAWSAEVSAVAGKTTGGDYGTGTVDTPAIASGAVSAYSIYQQDETNSVETTSTDWVDIPGFSITFTLSETAAVILMANVNVSAVKWSQPAGAHPLLQANLILALDGSTIPHTTRYYYYSYLESPATYSTVQFNTTYSAFHVASLSAGQHTVKGMFAKAFDTDTVSADARTLAVIVLKR